MIGTAIGWFEVIVLMMVAYILFPAWIYVVFKLATMGIFEGILSTIIKGDVENGEKIQINEEKGKGKGTGS